MNNRQYKKQEQLRKQMKEESQKSQEWRDSVNRDRQAMNGGHDIFVSSDPSVRREDFEEIDQIAMQAFGMGASAVVVEQRAPRSVHPQKKVGVLGKFWQTLKNWYKGDNARPQELPYDETGIEMIAWDENFEQRHYKLVKFHSRQEAEQFDLSQQGK